jgi:hypothetical protein
MHTLRLSNRLYPVYLLIALFSNVICINPTKRPIKPEVFFGSFAGFAGFAGFGELRKTSKKASQVPITSRSSDLSKSMVLDSIHKHEPYTAAEDWKKTLGIRTKGTTQICHYTRPYLQNASTNAIITVQGKAWIDGAGITMWVDTQLRPLICSFVLNVLFCI